MSAERHRIVCLTEESVETLFRLGKGHLVVGVSHYVKRPVEAQKLPKISFFTHADLEKVVALKPTLVLGFSDLQKDIARELIGRGLNVFITNQRSLSDIENYIAMLSSLVEAKKEGERLISQMHSKRELAEDFSKSLTSRPRVYIEEWDEPLITGIRWFSEIIELCGGYNIFLNQSCGPLAADRFVSHEAIIKSNPHVIFACWCGKRVKLEAIKKRSGYDKIEAVMRDQVYELEPEIFLQPGPAPFLDGIDHIIKIFRELQP